MEWGWALLLTVGLSCRESRLFAVALAVKWAVNYGTYLAGWPWAHMAVDLLVGTVLVCWAGGLPTRRWKDVVALAAMTTMVAHAFLLITWLDTVGANRLHYWTVIGLFTLQAAAVATPRGLDLARRCVRSSDHRRRGLAGRPVGHAPVAGRRPDPQH